MEERIKKVSTEAMLQQLTMLFNMGVNYVDLHGIPPESDEVGDTLVFSFNKDYIDPDAIDLFKTILEEDPNKEDQTVKIKPNIDDLI